jgi:hypothetical protein
MQPGWQSFKMVEPMDLHWALLTIRDYVCSNCWRDLIQLPANNQKWLVQCRSCQEQTKGFVTKYFAESRRAESRVELMEARTMLQEMGIMPKSGKTEAELLREMGY